VQQVFVWSGSARRETLSHPSWKLQTMTATFAPTAPRSAVPARVGRPAGMVVVVPARRPATTVYIRRRLVVGAAFLLIVLGVWFGAGTVLANRGGAPASTPTVRPAATYLAQPGDTMWSIAAAHHDGEVPAAYLDALIELNGGTALEVGQVVVLP